MLGKPRHFGSFCSGTKGDNTGRTLWRCGKARDGNKRDVIRWGLCAYPYGSQYTKYNVDFVCSAVVERILIIQSVQRNASTHIALFPRAFLDCRLQQWKCWSERWKYATEPHPKVGYLRTTASCRLTKVILRPLGRREGHRIYSRKPTIFNRGMNAKHINY